MWLNFIHAHILLQQMSETSAKHFSLDFNCGFARCAIRELTPKVRNSAIDKQQRMTGFQELFKDCPDYGVPLSYFDASSNRGSLFNRHCDKVIEGWSKKWHPSENRLEYEKTFSIANWKALTALEKQKHTLACCQECCNEYQVLQQSFPLKPCYLEEPLVVINKQKLEKLGKKEATRTALSELNDSFSGKFQSTFVDSLVTHGGQRLQVTPLSLSLTHTHTLTPSPLSLSLLS